MCGLLRLKIRRTFSFFFFCKSFNQGLCYCEATKPHGVHPLGQIVYSCTGGRGGNYSKLVVELRSSARGLVGRKRGSIIIAPQALVKGLVFFYPKEKKCVL